MPWTRDELAARAARELPAHCVANLGIGIPTLIANHLNPADQVVLHSENGLLGMGPFPYDDEVDAQVINAGKQTVTVIDGGSTFDSAQSFAMIRGGHVDVAVLGAMQVSVTGDLANWMVPGKKVAGIGGAMDLATGARRVIAVMTQGPRGQQQARRGLQPSLTSMGCVDLVITDLGVLAPERETGAFRAVELAREVSLEELREATAAPVVHP